MSRGAKTISKGSPNIAKKSSKSKTWLDRSTLLRITLLLGLVYAGNVLLTYQMANMTIHSCQIYSPSILGTLSGMWRSLVRFVNEEGISALGAVFVQLVKSEVILSPPYFSNEDIVGKKLLMVGGGYIPEFLRHAKILGVEIYLLDDPKMANRTKGLVTQFIGIPQFGRVSIVEPQAVVNKALETGVKFDGVFTLVEDEGPLVSILAETLNLPGNSLESSKIARNKFEMRKTMKQAGLPTPRFALIEKESDLERAAKEVGFPSFLKPVFGVAASFAEKIDDVQDLTETWKKFQTEMDPSNHSIYWYGEEMILEEMLDGPEIQLELMIHQGEVIFHCFSSEYSPTREYLVFPVNLTKSQQEAMFKLASDTVKAIGLSNGVVHIEMFYSSKGPQIIEVNNRLSRGFLPRRFSHQLMFGDKLTDYFASVIYLALGKKPPTYQREIPPFSISIFLDNPSLSGWETEGGCAIFFGPSPKDCLDQGIAWKKSLKGTN